MVFGYPVRSIDLSANYHAWLVSHYRYHQVVFSLVRVSNHLCLAKADGNPRKEERYDGIFNEDSATSTSFLQLRRRLSSASRNGFME